MGWPSGERSDDWDGVGTGDDAPDERDDAASDGGADTPAAEAGRDDGADLVAAARLETTGGTMVDDGSAAAAGAIGSSDSRRSTVGEREGSTVSAWFPGEAGRGARITHWQRGASSRAGSC